MGGMSRGDEDIPSLDLLLFGEEPSYDDPDAPEASPSDVAYASVLAEAFRELKVGLSGLRELGDIHHHIICALRHVMHETDVVHAL